MVFGNLATLFSTVKWEDGLDQILKLNISKSVSFIFIIFEYVIHNNTKNNIIEFDAILTLSYGDI